MTFRVGQKVVCVKQPSRDPRMTGEVLPSVGEIYTIRGISEYCRGTGVCLREIVNAPRRYADGLMEAAFATVCFRPLVERKTDISIFTALLTPTTSKRARKVDAEQ